MARKVTSHQDMLEVADELMLLVKQNAEETQALRNIVSECAEALGNGAGVSPESTIEFMENLPGEIRTHVASLKKPDQGSDVLQLWAHLIARHALVVGTDASYEDLMQMHADEHAGPGTIRDHRIESRECDPKKFMTALQEALDDCDDDDNFMRVEPS